MAKGNAHPWPVRSGPELSPSPTNLWHPARGVAGCMDLPRWKSRKVRGTSLAFAKKQATIGVEMSDTTFTPSADKQREWADKEHARLLREMNTTERALDKIGLEMPARESGQASAEQSGLGDAHSAQPSVSEQ